MFGGSWGQNNQQQQQQQQPQQGFGFGAQQPTATGFGQPQNTGFGQPAQQNTGGLFGGGGQSTGFGAPAQNTANTSFTFGANNQTQQNNAFGARPGFGATGGSTFGQPANNTGGGLFGSTSNTSTFGASNNNTFGKPATGGFGAGQTSGLFGASQPAGGFGSGAGTSNSTYFDVNDVHDHTTKHPTEVPPTGSAQPLYAPTWHKDPLPTTGNTNTNLNPSMQPKNPNPPHLFHSINAMLPYRGATYEELRFLDYEQGRKEAGAAPVAAPGGFGQPAAGGFGQPAQQTTGFGQPQNSSPFGAKPATGLFGSTAPATTGFGASSTGGGLFGQTNTNTNSGGLFGQTQPQQQSTGLFGSTNNNQQQPSTGLFGQQQSQQQNQGGGLFSNPNPFGGGQQQQQQQQQPAAGGFSFGASTAAKPAFGATGTTGFGQTNTASTGFGQPAQANTGFTFGQNNQQQQQQQPAAGGGLFGGGGFGTNNNAQPASTGLFGQTNQQQQQQGQTGGLFGSTAAKPATGGLFGGGSTATGNTGFTFGQNNSTQQQPATTGGLFGSNTAPNTGTGLFGQTTQQQQNQASATGGGLFGNTANTGGIFGAKPAATAPTGGLFGNTATQPAAQNNSLFGSTNNNSTGLFGSTNNTLGQQNQQQNKPAGTGLFGGDTSMFGQQNQQQQPAGGGMFGTQSTTGGGMFGSTSQQPQQTGLGGSLFGGGGLGLGQSQQQQPQQQQQPSLTASIDQNPYGNNPLFAYSGQTLDLGSQNKKPALPPLTSSTFRLTPSRKSQVNKLRGFASPAPSSPGRAGSPLNGLTTPGRTMIGSPIASDRYKGLSDTVLPANAFVPRPSIKRLTVTPKSSGFGNSEDHLESVLGKSAIRSSNSTPTASREVASPAKTQSPATLLFNPTASASSSRAAESTSASANGSASRSAVSDKQSKNGDYWCRPKLEKLRQLSERDLRDMHNFTAGRKGYGEVTFLEPVDLTSVELDTFLGTVIVFSEMELAVYPEDSADKPARGDGLNVPAQITLENCYSKDKATKQPITDPNDPRHSRFLKRVKNIPDTEFVSYADGIWSFKVQHFSRYGLRDESDEENEAGGGKMVRKARKSSRTPSRTPPTDEDDEEDMLPPTKSRYDSEHTSPSEDDESNSGEESQGTTVSASSDGSESPSEGEQEMEMEMGMIAEETGWKAPVEAKLGVEGMKKLKEMQKGFFASRMSQEPTARAIEGKGRVAKRPAENHLNQDFRSAGEGDTALDNRAAKRASFGQTSRPAILRQVRKYAKVSMEKGMAKDSEGIRADSGLAWGRSGSAVWGFGGEVVHLGRVCGPRSDFVSEPDARVMVEKVSLLAEDNRVESARSDRVLKLHLERSQIDLVDGVPTAAIDSSLRFADFASLFDAGDHSHEANVFRLGVALFDEIDLHLPLDASDDLVNRIMEVRRKLALSKWLQDAVAPSVDAELVKTDNKPSKLFTLLSGNQVDRAVQAAIEGNDVRLATLLAQIGGSEQFREEIMRQLEDWKKYKANPLISVEYRRLYALLAGITDVSPGDASRGVDGCPDEIISKDLDWKRAFGVQMWYGNRFEDSIPTVLDSYTSALASPHPPATPRPPYLEKPATLAQNWRMSSQPTDILFGLIRLYSDPTISLDQVLRSRDASPSPFDMRVIWYLYILLSRIMGKRDFEDRDTDEVGYSAQADQVTVGYAAQLEGTGDWVGSAFILMHLETTEGREQALRALLHRHPAPPSDEHRRLTQTLKVPPAWIHESKAAMLASDGDAYGEYQELVNAGLYDRAHRILVGKLLPEVILRDDLDLIRKMCKGVEGKAEGWEYGGKLFIDYANVSEEVPRLLTSVLRDRPSAEDSARLVDLAKTVPRLIQLLPAVFPDRNDVQQIAGLGDMLSNLHNLAGSLSVAGYISRPAVSSLMVDVDRLHLLQAATFESFEKSLQACVAVA